MFTYSSNKKDNHAEIRFIGDLDIDATEMIEDEMKPLLKKCNSVNIDFTEVHFVDSTGVGLLLTLVYSLAETGVRITISNVSCGVKEIFEILQISDIVGDGVFV
jgi:anti-sigma B factor antagonist